LFNFQIFSILLRYFAEFSETDFTRAGTVAEETIEFNEGPLFEMPGSLESQLRKLGMPVKLEKGIFKKN
jgi:hypothetical protein